MRSGKIFHWDKFFPSHFTANGMPCRVVGFILVGLPWDTGPTNKHSKPKHKNTAKQRAPQPKRPEITPSRIPSANDMRRSASRDMYRSKHALRQLARFNTTGISKSDAVPSGRMNRKILRPGELWGEKWRGRRYIAFGRQLQRHPGSGRTYKRLPLCRNPLCTPTSEITAQKLKWFDFLLVARPSYGLARSKLLA